MKPTTHRTTQHRQTVGDAKGLARIGLVRRRVAERREHPRRPFGGRATIHWEGRQQPVSVTDIARGGALLEGQWQPMLGDPVVLALATARGQRQVNARVQRVRPARRGRGAPRAVALLFV